MDEQHLILLMHQHDVRPTSNRILVAKTLSDANHPLSMGELEDLIGSIDKSGISRTLTLFKDHHLVHVLEDTEYTRFELCRSLNHQEDNDMHVHFHCLHCGAIICLKDHPIPPIELPEGFKTEHGMFILKGVCPKCRKKTDKQ